MTSHFKAIAYCEHVHPFFIYDWFLSAVGDASGDGWGKICCANPADTAKDFEKWYCKKFNAEKFVHPLDSYIFEGTQIYNYHDANENYVFVDNLDLIHEWDDIAIVIKEDCTNDRENFTIRKLDCSHLLA